ncbi:MAG: hypothetical protein M1370_05150 [Bacteroidetes bacterium]|nr:hypothetical protein [Bacteroidota bacterium]
MFSKRCILGLVVWLSMMALACQSPLSRAAFASTATPLHATSADARPAPETEAPALTPSPPAGVGGPAALLADTLGRLDSSAGYRYSITSTLSFEIEGKPVDWRYTGQGATAPPDRYEWDIRGPAGQSWHVVSVAGQTVCSDSGGPQKTGCGLAWGGPSPGSSPYTAIAYLRFAEELGGLERVSMADRDYYHFTFSPSLAQLTGLDDSHQAAIRQVTNARGEVWVDKMTGTLRRVQIAILSVTPSGREQQTSLALTFFELGQPVDIVLPKAGR